MRVRVIPFGVFKHWLGSAPVILELRVGDEIGLLSPVSGGAARSTSILNESVGGPSVVALMRERIDAPSEPFPEGIALKSAGNRI